MAVQRPLIVANGRRTILPSGYSVLGASPFHELCHIAGMQPTLYLDFARQDFRHYSPATGLREKALSDIVTFTRASNATYFDAKGVMQAAASNVPRLDFDPVTGLCRGLLIEESRTNLLKYSQELDNAAWGKALGSISANQVAAPDGTLTADLFTPDASVGDHTVSQSILGAYLSVARCFSVYIKPQGVNIYHLSMHNAAQTIGIQAEFDFQSITATPCNYGSPMSPISPSITSVGGGWYRCVIGGALANTTEELRCRIIRNYTGDGVSGVYIWGAQLEAGSFPTSYIPTTTATATRAADQLVISGTTFSDFWSRDSFSVVLSANAKAVTNLVRLLAMSNNTTSENSELMFSNGGLLLTESLVGVSPVSGGTVDANTNFGTAFSVTRTGSQLYLNGAFVDSSSHSDAEREDVTQIVLGARYDKLSQFLNGFISEVVVFPKALTAAQLQQLSALTV